MTFMIKDISISYYEAMTLLNLVLWKEVIYDEYNLIISNTWWILITLPLANKPLDCK